MELLGAAPYNAEFMEQNLSAAETFVPTRSYTEDEDAVRFRELAVRVIEQQSKYEKFDSLVPYLAMIYFDRVVLTCNDEFWTRGETLGLFIVSCLSIASKMRTGSFELSQFLKKNILLVEVNAATEMELYICKALEWKLLPITPLTCAEHFIYVLQSHFGGRFPRRPVRQMIMKSQANVNFLCYEPSIMGASTVLVVSSKLFPQQFEAFKNYLSNFEYISQKTVELSECMEDIQPLYKPPPAPKPQSEAKPDEPSSSTSRKRKRGEISPRLLAASAAPAVDLNEVIRSRASDPIGPSPVGEINPEIGPAPKPAAKESELDELMNFELEWTDENGVNEEERQLARTILVEVRKQGHPCVDLREDGKKLTFFCEICFEKCDSDSELFEHLKEKIHIQKLAAVKSTLLKANLFPFSDGRLFFHFSTENYNRSPAATEDKANLAIPSVLHIEHVSNLEVRFMGFGRIGARSYEKDGISKICRIWCEWLGKKLEKKDLGDDGLCRIPVYDFAVVIFSYDHNLGNPYDSSRNNSSGVRYCNICRLEMLPGKSVAALLNRNTGRLACHSRNSTGAFHVSHISCLIRWILLELKPNGKKLDASPVTSVRCPECQGTGINIEEGKLEKPPISLSEIFKVYQMEAITAYEAWTENPEKVEDNSSIGLYFPQTKDGCQGSVSPLKLLCFYYADNLRPWSLS